MTSPDNPVLQGGAVYSQFDEDGIIRECLRRIGLVTTLSRTFVEVGCADGLENNTHLLLLDGYRGIWIDGDGDKIRDIGQALGGTVFEQLWIVESVVGRDSSPLLARRSRRFLGVESVDFYSLNIDGNDWHVLPQWLQALAPKLVCVEYNAKFPPPSRLVMRYDDGHSWRGNDYFGASLQSWVDRLASEGYTLVSCNLTGANAFFVRDDLLKHFTRYPIDTLFQPPRYHLIEAPKGHKPSLLWARQQLERKDSGGARFVRAEAPGAAPFPFAIHKGTDEFVSGDIARTGVWEPFETMVFGRLCLPGDLVLDLGANIGWYSVLAATFAGPTGAVLSFEPDPVNARLLELNAAVSDRHGVIKIFRCAVGDKPGEELLHRSPTNLGDHRMFTDGSERESGQVDVTTLDAFFKGVDTSLPSILKSDTQGSEARILRGAKGLFDRGWRPAMILEFWPFGLTGSGDDPMALWQDLHSLGYRTFEVSEGNPRLVPLDVDRLRQRLESDIAPATGRFINLLCIPKGSDRTDRIADLIVDS